MIHLALWGIRGSCPRDQAKTVSISNTGEGEAKVGRWLWCPGKGQHPAQLLGVRDDFLDYTVDRSPHKHGKFLPGTHVPIFLRKESAYPAGLPRYPPVEYDRKRSGTDGPYYREWGGKFVALIPEVEVLRVKFLPTVLPDEKGRSLNRKNWEMTGVFSPDLVCQE